MSRAEGFERRVDLFEVAARAFLAVQDELGSFDAYLWRFVQGRAVQNRRRSVQEVPARTELSDTIAKDLSRRGFKFVGTTIVYAYLQAVGLVNDHVVGCFRHAELAGIKKASRRR